MNYENWLVYDKNNNIVADVESEEEAIDVVEGLETDLVWKDDGPFRIEVVS